jgi:hypothetical protein
MNYYKKNSIRLKLIPTLIREQKLNIESLTDKLNDELADRGIEPVSTRTVGRDLNILKSEGLTIKTQKDENKKNYFIISGYNDEFYLNESEKKMLPIMMGLLNTESDLSVINWLKDILVIEYDFKKEDLDPSPYFIQTTPSINFKDEMLLLTAEIIEYIKNQQAILFAYKEPQNYKNVAPLQVRYFDGRYYLLGIEFDDENNYETKNELITYSIDNIIEKKITPAIKEIDGFDDELIYFNYNKLYKESHLEILMEYSLGIMYNRIYKRNKVKKYRFKFTGWAISYIANKKFHPSQKTIEKNNDYIIIELTLWEIMDNKLFDEQGIEVWDNKEVDFFVERFEDKCERLN